jgi:hypothetical protein
VDGDANARGHRHLVAVQVKGRAQRDSDLVGDERCALLTVLHHEDHGKLVAAEAPDRIPQSQTLDQAVAQLREQFVAERVTQRVIHILEVIHVDKQHRDGPAMILRLAQRLLERFDEERAIRESGERV